MSREIKIVPMEEVLKEENERKIRQLDKVTEDFSYEVNSSLYDIMCDRMEEYDDLEDEKTIKKFTLDVNNAILGPGDDLEKMAKFVDLVTDFIRPYIKEVSDCEFRFNNGEAIKGIMEDYRKYEID